MQFYHFPQIDKCRIGSSNVLERIKKEIGQGPRVLFVFPFKTSCLRLIATHLMEYMEECEVERSYIKLDKLLEVMDI